MNRQQIFDTAYKGLSGQGFERSVDGYGECLYRGPGGLKCAIGHCISDMNYQKYFEGTSVTNIQILASLGVSKRRNGDTIEGFLLDLQGCHDNAFDAETMQLNLKIFARNHRLKIPEVSADV